MEQQAKKRHPTKGFASMDPILQRQIASKGGKSVDPAKRSFSVNRELAQQAGRKGGSTSRRAKA